MLAIHSRHIGTDEHGAFYIFRDGWLAMAGGAVPHTYYWVGNDWTAYRFARRVYTAQAAREELDWMENNR